MDPAAIDLPGVAGVWSFGSGERAISVWFLDGNPLEAGPALGEVLGDPRPGSSPGPFETITPGVWGWFDE